MVKHRWYHHFIYLIVISFIIVIMLVLLVTTHLSKKRSLSIVENRIDSLSHETSRSLKKIEELKVELEFNNKKIFDLTSDVIVKDSISNFFKEESDRNRLKYKKVLNESKSQKISISNSENSSSKIRQIEERLTNCKKNINNCQSDTEELQRQIALQKATIDLLRSRHDLPILFFLYSSLSYYPSDYFDDSLIKKELNRIISINSWPYTSEYIEDIINSSTRLKYRGIKWAQQKLGVPIEATYLLIKGYKQDPERSDEDAIMDIFFDSFKQFPINFKFCSDHLRTININESKTFKVLDNTIACLISNYNKYSKSKRRFK